ncbi:MAG: CAP domain-containing protein [Caldilineaceae bacterium]
MSGCNGEVVPSSNEEFEARLVVLTNQVRVQYGLLPLKRVPTLDNASRYHATDMGQDDYFAHSTQDLADGRFVEVCTWSTRVDHYYTGWSRLAENIAAGYTTPEAVMAGWMESDGHRANILNDELTEIGIGYFSGAGSYRHYWVQDFGSRWNNYPLIIDLDAPATDSGAVTLHLHGEWDKVRLRTDEGAWSDWVAFEQGMPWQIFGEAGEHIVQVEMQDGERTVSSSDAIYLMQSTVAAPTLSALPDQLSFTYYRQQQQLTPSSHQLRPLEEAVDGYRWQVIVDGNWLSATPNESTGAEPFEVQVEVSSAENIRNSTASVTVNLLDSENNIIDSHVTSVVLEVNEEAMQQLFLPGVVR